MSLNCQQITVILQEILRELRAYNDQQIQVGSTEIMLLPEEVCERLRISKSTLKNYRKVGLPHYQSGNRHYYHWSEILQFMRRNAYRKYQRNLEKS